MKHSTSTKLFSSSVFLLIASLLTVTSASANQADDVILYLNDPLGSAIAAFDSSGNTCWEETYTPYGEKQVREDSFQSAGCGAITEERGFTGHSEDYDTDLVYMQQRYYDPTIGRFLSIDPVGPVLGDPGSINRYSYGKNNPYKYIDPNGEEPVTASVFIGYGVVALGVAWTATDTYSVYKEDGAGAAVKTAVIGGALSVVGGKVASKVAQYGGGWLGRLFSKADDVDVPNSAPDIKWGSQEKHFPGHNNYIPGRSTLTADPRKLAEKAGTGQQVGKTPLGQPGSKERVDFGELIGDYVDQATGNATPTSNGIIHYSKNGIHIVPARP